MSDILTNTMFHDNDCENAKVWRRQLLGSMTKLPSKRVKTVLKGLYQTARYDGQYYYFKGVRGEVSDTISIHFTDSDSHIVNHKGRKYVYTKKYLADDLWLSLVEAFKELPTIERGLNTKYVANSLDELINNEFTLVADCWNKPTPSRYLFPAWLAPFAEAMFYEDYFYLSKKIGTKGKQQRVTVERVV